MSYTELVFTISEEDAESFSDALMNLGALSISVADANANTSLENPLYGEPGLTPEKNAWEQSLVTALFDSSQCHATQISAALSTQGFVFNEPVIKEVPEQDWVRLTQSQFEPIQVGQRLWVVPSWHEQPAQEDAICLAVDPGLAFGTGSHPTTKLCMQWLEEHDGQAQSILDYGCGSGILAIAAKKLGYGKALGVDIDPQAMQSAKDNALNNQVEVDFFLPNDDLSHSKHDVVVANILANPLQVLAPALCERVKPNGFLILSGILERQADEVIQTYSEWLPLSVWRSLDGWVCLVGQMPFRLHQKKTKSALKSSWRYRVAAFTLTLCAFLQLMHLGRDAISLSIAKSPETIKPYLGASFHWVDQQLCSLLSCKNLALEDFSAWSIDYANLQIVTHKQTPRGILQFQIHHQYEALVAWPSMELTINDDNDQVIAKRIFSSSEWLPQNLVAMSTQGSMGPTTVSHQIHLELPLAASGYRLRLIYPTN